MHKDTIRAALIGNPNSGKTTIFNEITGARQKVGNWAGVTVEKKEGYIEHKGHKIEITDLPGTYSLTAYSIEEIVSRNFILDEKPDVVIDVIDSSSIERSLYLATQLIELDIKLIFALNMMDIAISKGYQINREKLAELLGVPVVFTVGNKGSGVEDLVEKIVEVAEDRNTVSRHIHIAYGREIEKEIKDIQSALWQDPEIGKKYSTRWLSVKLIENDNEVIDAVSFFPEIADNVIKQVEQTKDNIYEIYKEDPEIIISDQRYGFINGALKECLKIKLTNRIDVSQKVDLFLTNRFIGIPIFIFFIWLMFQSTFKLGAIPADFLMALIEYFSSAISFILPDGLFQDMIVNGIIGGVGSVLVFLPNILILFFFIALFEDTGYMARAAFLMDKFMHIIGLHGRSFIPMLMGFGCNAPAIMATRTLENENDRLLSILINPLISCSARLPVYILIAGTFFPQHAGNAIFSIYIIGIVLAIVMGKIFRVTLFKGETAPFVMELPPYRMPTIKGLVIHMWERGKIFLQKATGMILIASMIIWALGTFPLNRQESDHADIKKTMEGSYLYMLGKSISPLLQPLGMDWQESVALISGVAAKEVIVSTMGVIYTGKSIDGEDTQKLSDRLRESGMTPLRAYTFMVFVLIYSPCIVALAVMRRETNSFKWLFFSVGYSLSLAWITSFIISKTGKMIGL